MMSEERYEKNMRSDLYKGGIWGLKKYDSKDRRGR